MREFESFYPLSPTQQGLLFHSLLAPGSGVYVGHLVCRLHGSLSPGALREAWQSVLDRHGALRTSFRWEDLKEPVQVVHREVELPFTELDWRKLGAEEQAARMEDLLHEDRARGFDLAAPPLLRCLLVRLDDEVWDFVWARHHLILDGWSVALLLQEVFASYAALVSGRQPALPKAPSYRDYIVWLRRQGREDAEARWRRVLLGVTAATPLGVDSGRGGPIDREERYGHEEARLSPRTSAALQAGARRSGLTVNTLFQGAWALLLARYSGTSDVVFGTVVSGRPAAVAGIEAMVGLFINTQPLRARVPETGGLLSWLRALQAEQAGLRQDEHLSLQEIQAWSEVPRGQPLFESLLVFENFPMDASLRSGAATPPGLRVGEVRAGDRTNFPLTLVTGPSDPWTLTVGYDRSRFSSAAISRLLGHLGVLLDALAEGLERPIEALPLLTAAERSQILEDWNRTAEPGEGPASVPAWVAGPPDAVALRFEGREMTYAELDRRARALAVQLRRLGVGPGTRVAVALERSEAMVVALLGTMKAGAAYVPLDPAYPQERLDYMRSDSGARVLLGEGGLAPADWSSEAPDEALPDLPAELPCYLIYTSGSTGRPKAVEIPHGAVVNFLRAMQSRLGLAAGETLVAVTSLSFDIAGLELFLPLGVGGTIELASREVAADGVRLRRLIEQSGATVLQATPSTWRLLRAAGFAAKPPFRQLCGGEALPRELADSLLAGGAALWNLYGPTETTIWSAVERVEAGPGPVSLGRPIRNTTLYVLDRSLRPVPAGVDGELYIGGSGLALGYAGQPGETAERFGPDPFGTVGGRLYRTGDLVRWLEDGRLEYRGRLDYQVKLRGHRIELGEVEAGLERHPEVAQAVAAVREGPGGEPRLVTWVVPAPGAAPSAEALRRHLEEALPAVMVPGAWVFLPELPLTPNGKVDRKALPEPEGRAESAAYEAPESEAEQRVAEAWQQVLGLDRAGRHDNFFDLGGSSMLAIQVHHKLQRSLGVEVSLVDLFEHPTIARLAAALQARIAGAERELEPVEIVSKSDENAVAVIGMACRVPGAWSVEEYWQNLLGGVESITFFSREELLASGLTEEMVDDPRLIAARGCLAGIEDFDASFFGVTPREAELLDPQHRIFLECAWEALERAGYGGEDTKGRVGVFAGASLNGYLLAHIAPQIERLGRDGSWEILLGNDKDYLTTRASYLLGLTGPSMLVQTACSTSLVAIHMARESMLRGECELALAGGISGRVPQAMAHVYQEGGITSPDGHCRAFDASARGTVGGNGIGVVVLKKLGAALRDGDRIVAVLKGSAINNDGARKVGFTAPSVEGQASVIRAALAAAGVDGASVGYVEAHGTGTPLGDPIEVRALAQALGGGRSRPYRIGSVKTNIGHLDTAAGVVGFIKAALSVEQGEIPPSLHFEAPNPQIDWASGPFEVVRERTVWVEENGPRRAGVSAFGIGGTNAHAVLEEAPPRRASGPSRPFQLLVWSAKTASALSRMTEHLEEHLSTHPEQALADVAWTLAVGRRRFAHRRALVCGSAEEAVAVLDTGRGWDEAESERGESPPPVAFLFPGQGSVRPGMGEALYRQEPVFRQAVERLGGGSVVARLYGPEEGRWTAEELEETQNAQPALFVVSYALAELWRSWGLEPWAMLGHSVGEYVAATLAGVLEPEAALSLVEARATLMGRLPRGAMLSVELPAAEAEAWTGDGVSLAAENGPRLSVLSGPLPAIERVAAALEAQGISCRRLATSHAFHSAMMEPILEAFGAAVSRVKLSPPRRRYLSGLTGTWIKAEEATDPGYWVRHLRERVRFSAALAELLGRGRMACVEVGPGRALSSLVRSHPAKSADTWAFGSLPPAGSEEAEGAFVLRSLGRYWLAGGEVSWERFFGNESRRREPLPPYPFERRRYWLETAPREEAAAKPAVAEAPPGRSNRPHLPSTYVAPETDAERVLVRIWEDLLHIAPIGVDDDFFELGGHSLLGTQVMSRAGSAFGRPVPLGFLFEAPTVARLAARLAEGGGGAVEPEAPLFEAIERPEALPLSFAQQRLWFLDRLAPGGAVHNIYLRVRFEGDCDPAALARALTELVRRHETLRTTFAIEGWSPVQRIAPPAPLSLPAVDLAGLPVKERAAAVDRRVAEHKAEPFDLEKGPLFTVRLLRLSEREHQLLLHLHHIIADGWSVGVIARELAALYAAFSEGRPSPLPELPLQYADYALWQRRWLQGERVERELDYWRRQLAGLSPQQDLPLPAPRPPDPTFRAGEVALTLPEDLSAALRSLSHEAGASLFMTLLAGFKALLLRYLGQEDLCVGSPVAGRSRPELEGLVGLFLNNLALRTSLGGDPPFRELLERVRGTALEALSHQHVPFEKLLEELAPERDLSRTPLFRVFFNMLNLPLQEVRLPGLRLEAVSSPVRVSMFDLTLYATEREGRLRTLWVYNAGLLEAAQVERMPEHFRALLEGVVADPDRRLLDLPLLSAAERRQVVRPLAPLPPAAGSIGARFRETAARFPGRPAVADPVRGFRSYREIEEMAERVGRALLSLGGRSGERVGLLFDPGPEMVAGLLGTLFSGQAYVALDPRYPRERLELLLADSGASALVAGERYAALAEGLAAGRPVVVPEREPQATERTAWPQVPAGALAYILYTSGSTGLPKGVMQSHGNVLRHVENYADGLDLGPEDRLSLLSSYAFDGAVMDIFGALLSGAALCPLDLRSGAPDLAGWVRDTRITVYHSTPTVYRLFVQGLRPGEVLPDLRRIVLGGEEAKRGDFEAFRRFAPPGAVFINGLGPSEATLALQIHLSRRSTLSRGAVPAGRPVAGLGVRLVHAGGEQVAVYGTGEIVLEGPQIALGYWRRPEATAAAFAPGASGRAYRTGDLGRLLPDGTIEFAGRVDQQVKIRGHRVEPGEVEACLLALPEVAEAAVVPFDEPGGGRALAAYAVPAAGARIRPEALRDALRSRLQEFLVPSSFHVLAALPRTPNGKLDRRALPEPAALRRSGPEGPRVAPRTRKELRLAEIWTRLLGVPEVGVHDDFFALGGHSLLLLQMAGQVREAFGVDLPLAAVYRSPTIADLTEIIVRSQRYPLLEEGVRLAAAAGGAGSRLVPLRPEGTLPPLFCVHAVGGHLLDFHDLVRELGPDQPVFGLQSRGFESDEEPLATIEEMAAAYLEAVRGAKPRGPYRLAGYCVGGLVAYEMARQLRAAGEEVELLAVLDARADRGRRAELGDAMIEGFAAYSFAVELNLRIAPERFEEAGPERFPDLIWEELCRSSEETARQLGGRTFRRLYRVFVANRRASWTYRPGPYDGGLVLFEPQHSTYPAETRASALGWRELCAGPVEHAVVPGGHVTMMREPQVAALARRLRATAAPVRAAAVPFTTTQGDGE